ncbi:MAG: rhomboid family intramembrane serine protease, partial [Candidatus Hydrogenedentota bacterium]
MSYTEYRYAPPFRGVTRALILIYVGIFLMQSLLSFGLRASGMPAGINQLEYFFALSTDMVLRGFIWQIFTYQFLHGGLLHLLFNSLALWLFGSELENHWGSKRFLKFYLLCGTGAGVFIFLLPLLLQQPSGITLG